MQYYALACKGLEADDIRLTEVGVGRGFGGGTDEGDKNLRKMRRALHDQLEEEVYRENKHGGS